MPDVDSPIPLAEAVRALRSEIEQAVKAAEGSDVRFRLGPIELEFGLEIGRKKEGEAGIGFWVVKLGGRGERTSATTHTVKLVLTPVGADGDIVICDTSSDELE